MSIRVILAEDDFLMREGIRRVLDAAPGITVTAECADGDELLAAVDADSPDIVVTDVRMPPSGADEGIRIANRLRRTHPTVGVIVLSPVRRARVRARAARAGVVPSCLPAQGACQ